MEQTNLGIGAKRRFSLECKYLILQEHREGGVPVSLLARKHGVQPITIYQWKRALMKKPEEVIDQNELLLELEKFRKENKQLKKALADMAIGKSILEDAVEILKKKSLARQLKSQKR